MPKLLHISTSPRGDASHTRRLAGVFIEAYRASNPTHAVEEIDLWSYPLPAFDATALRAKDAAYGKGALEEKDQATWQKIEAIADQFKSADKLLLSVPMWNFSIPYVLKHYIDIIMQPGLTFTYSSKTGYTGLIPGRPALVIQSSAGAYHEGSGWEGFDLMTPYLKFWLEFIGFSGLHTVTLPNTSSTKPADEGPIRQELIELSRIF